MEQRKRDAIIELHCAGHSPPTIHNLLKYDRSTIHRVIKRFDMRGDAKRKFHDPRSDRKRTPKFLSSLNKAVKRSPGTPMSVHAKNLNTSSSTISRALKELGYKSYALRVRHLLTESQKDARVRKGKKLLNLLKKGEFGDLRFFSDEKIFTVDITINRRNKRWICKEASEVPMVFRSKKPASVMVLGVISTNGDVMPPHFFKPGQMVNKEVYLEVIRDVVKHWMDSVARDKSYTFQQDSAPAHKSNLVQNWMKDNLPNFWDVQTWPPSSPDLNPCDFYL